MKKIDRSKLVIGQAVALTAGSIVGWREVISEIQYFCDINGVGLGGLTSFSGNITTNPIATPCFWGSIAFLVALGWTVYIMIQKRDEQFTHMKRIFWLLLGSTIFAAVNTGYTFYKYYANTEGSIGLGCPLSRIDNPLTTACFMGATAFLAALIFNVLYLNKYRGRKNSSKKDEKPE